MNVILRSACSTAKFARSMNEFWVLCSSACDCLLVTPCHIFAYIWSFTDGTLTNAANCVTGHLLLSILGQFSLSDDPANCSALIQSSLQQATSFINHNVPHGCCKR